MRSRKAYHHGNLREALIRASLEVIDEIGPKGLTLREVARRAGVSHNAPYRHFADKEDLLAAIAAEGFERLAETMERRIATGRTPRDWLTLAGRGYLEFALDAPSHYVVMFGLQLETGRYPALAEAGARAFAVLTRCIEDCRAAGVIASDDTLTTARVAWSLVHGVAMLANSGQLGIARAQVIAFGDEAMDRLYSGMAKRPSHA